MFVHPYSVRRKAEARRRPFRPCLVELESRLAPASGLSLETSLAAANVAFDASTGILSLTGGAAQVSVADGAVAVNLDGQTHSSDAASPFFDPSLAGASADSLRQLQLVGGGPGNALTLGDLTVDGGMVVVSDGGIDVAGAVHAAALTLSSAGLLNVEAGGSLNAGAITASADSFVNVGQVRADGPQGGSVVFSARDYLNAGVVSAAGAAGAGGSVSIGFGASYIDTASAATTASGSGGVGGQVVVSGSGRLFSSGRFDAAGASGGGIDLFGQSIALVAAAVDASGTAGNGGSVRIGGDYQGSNPDVPDAQTVEVSGATTVRADGAAAGGRVIVWSEASTDFAGSISARAAGFVEVSSHGQLTYAGQADPGPGGSLLLDPANLVIDATQGVLPQFNLMNPGADGNFGSQVVTLSSGNIVVADPTVNNNMGAVYLFDGRTGALISALTGSTGGTNGDMVGSGFGSYPPQGIVVLTNGNFVVASPNWNGRAGAATWASATTGVSGVVSASNSLVGSHANDDVGSGRSTFFAFDGIVALPNGNFVVDSPYWNGGMGAVTWGNGATGITGIVSSTNSLVGSTAGDYVGASFVNTFSLAGVTVLTNSSNYLVVSPNWNGSFGAVTWASGTTGIAGFVSSSNSLVGSHGNDDVGGSSNLSTGGGVTLLTNGNYVVQSPSWNSNMGAATWGSGAGGVRGVVSSSNSLVGSTGGLYYSSDQVGYAVTALTNGNYVVSSPNWTGYEGAATWGNGTIGVVGQVSAVNSLVGSHAYDQIGFGYFGGGIFALSNGNYVVDSPNWDGNGFSSGGMGAVTLGSGASGVVGIVSSTNSLVGSHTGDYVGGGSGTVGTPSGGIALLANGNFVVSSPNWNGNLGAVTWGSGTLGIVGAVSSTNSLVGSNANDQVGSAGNTVYGQSGVTALTNGNYVVSSPNWNGKAGAVTWGNGSTGVVGFVSSANSLIGTHANDNVGGVMGSSSILNTGVTALNNGNYVVASPNWNGAVGAVTWGNGNVGVKGIVSVSNSLIGSSANDQVGGGFSSIYGPATAVTVLANGNYVVDSPNWGGNLGAVTWGSGTAGVTGLVSSLNSLVGSTAGDHVGLGNLGSIVGIAALANGNYVVLSPSWNNSIGAVTWGLGTSGVSGIVTSANSFVGSTTGDQVGGGKVTQLPDGNYVVSSPTWNSNRGAATLANGSNGSTSDGQSTVTAQNSVVGSAPKAGLSGVQAGVLTGSFLVPFTTENGGRVALTFTDPRQITTALAPGQTISITPGFLTRSLNAGTSLVLQAANNITVNSPITETASGSASLTLQAGGSITLNAAVTTAGGKLTLSAPTITLAAFGSGTRSLALSPSAGQLTQGGQVYTLTAFHSVVASGAAADSAFLGDGPGVNSFLSTPNYSILSGPGYRLTVGGFGAVLATAGPNTNDSASLYDTAGGGTFVGRTDYSYFQTGGVTNEVVGFKAVLAGVGAGLSDSASLVEPAGSASFTAYPGYSYILAPGVSVTAQAFTQVKAYAPAGANDNAALIDNSGGGQFTGYPGYSYLQVGSFFNTAVGFAAVTAYAPSNSSDAATLIDNAGGGAFTGYFGYSFLINAGFSETAVNFPSVTAANQAGGNDSAILYDNVGGGSFAGGAAFGSQPASSIFVHGGYSNHAIGFASVTAVDQVGRDQQAYLYGSAAPGVFEASPNSADFRTPDYHYFLVVSGFIDIQAFSRNSGDSASLHDSAGDDIFSGAAADSFLKSAANNSNTYENDAVGFAHVYAYSSTGNDQANLTATGANNSFSASNATSLLAGSNYSIQVFNFFDVNALNEGSAATAYLFDTLDNDVLSVLNTEALLYSTTHTGSNYVVNVSSFTVSATATGMNDVAFGLSTSTTTTTSGFQQAQLGQQPPNPPGGR
jgi:hypothetical protein